MLQAGMKPEQGELPESSSGRVSRDSSDLRRHDKTRGSRPFL